jgi:hypothetical protein
MLRSAKALAIACAVLGAIVAFPAAASAAPANDNFANAQTLSGDNNDVNGNTTGATVEANEPLHAGYNDYNSVWFKWTPSTDGSAYMNINQYTWYPTIAVYTGSSLATLTPVKAAVGECCYYYYEDYAYLSFDATGGTTYYIAVDSRYGYESFFDLGWSLYTTAPSNDDFSSAQAVSGASGSVTGRNIRASFQTGEPYIAGDTNTATIWYSWVAPAGGTTTFDTETSDFDTVLGVYTGTNIGKLTTVATNDDCTSDDPASCVSFNAISGKTYRIQVTGYHRYDQGAVVLNWNQSGPGNVPVINVVYQRIALLPITSAGLVPESTEWQATPVGGAITSYDVQQSTNGGAFVDRTLSSPTATTLATNLTPGSTYQFKVRANNSNGHGEWVTTAAFLAKQKPDTANGIVYSSGWSIKALTGAWDNSVHTSSIAGKQVTFTFTGRNVSWIGTKGPNYGSADVYIDGVFQKTVNCHTTTSAVKKKQTLTRYGWGDVSQTHTITIVVDGTAGHPRIDVDAFVWFQ